MKRSMMITIGVFLILTTGSLFVFATAEDHIQSPESQTQTFMATLTIDIYSGEGCGCQPLSDITVVAMGIDTDHHTSGITDMDGVCTVELEYDQNYRFTIEHDDYQMMILDLEIIDDQHLTFHLQEQDEEDTTCYSEGITSGRYTVDAEFINGERRIVV